MTLKKGVVYGAVLIALYIGVSNATGAGTLITDATSGTTSLVKTFQGRS